MYEPKAWSPGTPYLTCTKQKCKGHSHNSLCFICVLRKLVYYRNTSPRGVDKRRYRELASEAIVISALNGKKM